MKKRRGMTPEEFEDIIIELFGVERGGNRILAGELKVHEVTISRWRSGAVPISEIEARAIRSFRAEEIYRRQRRVRDERKRSERDTDSWLETD